jgi:CMP/dCMP kinase
LEVDVGKPSTVAIDGPAASGKSTLGYHLAQVLDYLFLDTGVLYRAVTWGVLDQGISAEDEEQVTSLSQTMEIEVKPPDESDGRQCTVLVEGEDVTWQLRSPDVDQAVSPVSAYAGVREALTQRMRDIASSGHVIMVGRDIGTVVIPDADLKLYVVASASERARRRHKQLEMKGKSVSYHEVLVSIKRRDRIDSSREAAPLKPASDAMIFDTTDLTIEAMFGKAEALVECERPGPDSAFIQR